MKSCPGRDDMGIVRWRDHRDRSSAPGVEVAKIERQCLQLISCETVIVLEDVVVGRARSTQECTVRLQVKVKLEWMDDLGINDRAGFAVTQLVSLPRFHREKTSVMALLHHHKRDLRLVAFFEAKAGCSHGCNLCLQHLGELAL